MNNLQNDGFLDSDISEPSKPDTSATNHKDLIIMAVIMAVLFVVFCSVLYWYDQSHNASAQAVTKARSEVSTASKQITAVTAQNKTLTTQNATLTTRNTELMNEKSQFCGELGKAKINDPLCTQ